MDPALLGRGPKQPRQPGCGNRGPGPETPKPEATEGTGQVHVPEGPRAGERVKPADVAPADLGYV